MVPPIDLADEEVQRSLKERRPPDPVVAFPDPPPSIADQVAAGASPMAGQGEPDSWEQVPLDEVTDRVREHVTIVQGEPVRRRKNLKLGTVDTTPPPAMPAPEDTPAQRLAGVKDQSNAYLMEFRLKLLHRLLMRNLPLDTIAAQLQVSTLTVIKMRDELNRRLVYEAQTINRYEISGKTLGFYDEVQGMALRMADNAEAKPYVRLQALQTALSAMADRQRFLTASGFWAAAPFTPMDAVEDDSTRAAAKMHQLIEAVMSDDGTANIDMDATDAANVIADMETKLI